MKSRLAPLPIHYLEEADRSIPGIDVSWEYYNGVMKVDPKLNYTKLRGFSLQANYTDRATAACRRS
jgi:hypothetical protein